MVIIKPMGRLGNQRFGYGFALGDRVTGKKVKIDTTNNEEENSHRVTFFIRLLIFIVYICTGKYAMFWQGFNQSWNGIPCLRESTILHLPIKKIQQTFLKVR